MARGYKQREMNTHMQENEEHRAEKKKLVEEFGSAERNTPRLIIQGLTDVIKGLNEQAKADRQKIYELGLKVAELEAKCINLEGTLTEVRKATKEEVPQFGPA